MIDDEAMNYEVLIRRAFECQRGKKGGDTDIFRALFREEYHANEKPFDKKAQNALEKRILSIRTYLEKALEKAINRLRKQKDKSQAITTLHNLIDELQECRSTNQFSEVISKAMTVFIDHNITWTNYK